MEMDTIKILVVSDSHGNNGNIRKAIELESPFDYLVHCGDVEGPRSVVAPEDAAFAVKVVRGNCDFGNNLPVEEVFKAGFFNVWVTHGDKYNVKYEEKLEQLKKAAIDRCADIVFFGHSHYAEIVNDKENGILLVNPGSIGNPHTNAGKVTYAVVKVTEDYEIIPEIKELQFS